MSLSKLVAKLSFLENHLHLVKGSVFKFPLLAKREHEMFSVTEKNIFQAFVRNWWFFAS